MSYFSFDAKKEEDLIEMLQPGEGAFEVAKASAKTSKNNNPMIELILKVWDGQGMQGQIYDYMTLNPESKFSLRKIRHFCYCVGLQELYENGKLDPSDCAGKSGKIIIGIQKDKTGKYPDKSCVVDYVINDNPNTVTPPINDEIPF